MAAILEHFRCPVCLEIPECKIFQCSNGHTFCSQCSVHLKTCPQCRTHLPNGPHRIRNRTLEQLLDLMEFNCPNKSLGCGKLLKRSEILGHLKYCKFEPFYFCKLIGFLECQYNASDSNSTSLLSHLHEAHPEIQQSGIPAQVAVVLGAGADEDNDDPPRKILLIYQNLFGRANTLDKGSVSIWTPHLVHFTDDDRDHDDQDQNQKTAFLVLCQMSEVTRNVAWVCLRIAGTSKIHYDGNEDSIQFGISAHRDRGDGKNAKEDLMLTPEMTWKAPLLNFQDIDKDLESYALRIPFCTLGTLDNLRTKSGNAQVSLEFFSRNRRWKLKNNGMDMSMITNEVEIKELTTFITRTPLKGKTKCCGSCSRSHNDNGKSNRSANEDDDETFPEDNAEGVVFHDVYCNGCGQRPLIDIRYKCLQCIDYDLCKGCMEKRDTHSHHVFARIQDERQNELLNLKHRVRSHRGKSSYI